jgi:hypothetical protein
MAGDPDGEDEWNGRRAGRGGGQAVMTGTTLAAASPG